MGALYGLTWAVISRRSASVTASGLPAGNQGGEILPSYRPVTPSRIALSGYRLRTRGRAFNAASKAFTAASSRSRGTSAKFDSDTIRHSPARAVTFVAPT